MMTASGTRRRGTWTALAPLRWLRSPSPVFVGIAAAVLLLFAIPAWQPQLYVSSPADVLGAPEWAAWLLALVAMLGSALVWGPLIEDPAQIWEALAHPR